MIIIRLILLLNISLTNLDVEQFMLSKGVKVGVQIIRLADTQPLGSELAFFQSLQAAFQYKSYRHILVNPFYAGKLKYIGGYGTSLFSYSSWNDIPERRLHNLSAIAHELGHNLFRLKHSGTNLCKDLMDSNVLACSNLAELKYSFSQKVKIRFILEHRRNRE